MKAGIHYSLCMASVGFEDGVSTPLRFPMLSRSNGSIGSMRRECLAIASSSRLAKAKSAPK